MTDDPFAAVAESHREPVRKALVAGFGSARLDKIAPVGGGASGAFPFRASIGDRHYLVRVEGPASPLRNPHQYESMRIASAAGVAPRVHHIDEANRIAIMDFVEERPLSTFPGGPRALADAVGRMVRRVQETPTFPSFIDYPEMVGRLWWWICQTGRFAPGVLDPVTERLAQIRETYMWDQTQSVSSHNDPVPRNILFDGRRLWIVDWESAYRTDPLVDVAITLDGFAPTPELEDVLLRAWLGPRSHGEISDRLIKVQALTRLYYAGVLLSASADASGPWEDGDLSAPTAAIFRRSIQDGDIGPGSPAAKHSLGKMYVASFMSGHRPPGLDAAV